MTELERFIRNYDGGGAEGVARMLLAEPRFEGFNILWKQPNELFALCEHFGLETLQDAEAFAASLMDGYALAQPILRKQLALWLNPRPGVTLRDMQPVNVLQIQAVMVGDQIPHHAQFFWLPMDSTMWVPTEARFAQIMARCPARRMPWTPDHDCDDHTSHLRGWKAEHGIGPCTIGYGGYRIYDSANVDLGGHVLALAVVRDAAGRLVVRLGEPRDGTVHPISAAPRLGGFAGARAEFQLALF